LFYDPLLSSDRATACVSCHSEIWGLGDQLPRSVGVEGKGAIGPGRVGPNMTRRNSQPLWNLAYREVFFWDGRSPSLEEQVFVPLAAPEELNRPVDGLIADLAAIPEYVRLFREAFPEAEPAVSEITFAQALATFMRAYVSDRAPYDRYLAGDLRALSERDLRGMQVFAELGCHECHEPPRFDSDRYVNRHVPNPEGIQDLGRFEITGNEHGRGAFRVPTLRNVRGTGPYFHNGSVGSFEEAVRHEVEQQVAAGVRESVTPQEFGDLLEFLRRALTDVSREQHPPKAVPSGLPLPLDGDLILRGGHEP
jgi:cytochrome c peroxidase